MSHITTFTKVSFTPMAPRPEDIRVEDIAHALSLLCRANGHFPQFYSVGQHCLNCAAEAAARGYAPRLQLACLLHDASEAYLSDVTRPVKRQLPHYRRIEATLQAVIYEKYLRAPLNEGELVLVDEVDDAILYAEFLHFMGMRIMEPSPLLHSGPLLALQPFAEVEAAYAALFEKLASA